MDPELVLGSTRVPPRKVREAPGKEEPLEDPRLPFSVEALLKEYGSYFEENHKADCRVTRLLSAWVFQARVEGFGEFKILIHIQRTHTYRSVRVGTGTWEKIAGGHSLEEWLITQYGIFLDEVKSKEPFEKSK